MAKNKSIITIDERFQMVYDLIKDNCNWTTVNPLAKMVWLGVAIKNLEVLKELAKHEYECSKGE